MAAFGSVNTLSGGTRTLTIPAGTNYWFIQNQDITVLTVTFPAILGLSAVTLNAATVAPGAGDWLDSEGFPFVRDGTTEISVVFTGTGSAQFGTGATPYRPAWRFGG